MLEKVKILELTSDIVFKSFMLSEDTKEYTARLISLITKIPEKEILKNAVFNNVELSVKNKSDKRYRTDIIITIVKNIINIEMNREYYDGLFSKNNAYISKLYSDQFDVGDSYTNISKIIGINIDNFSKFRGNKFVYKFLPMEIETKEIEEENRESYHLDLEYLRNKCYNNDKLSELEKMCQIFIEEDFEHLENLKKGDDVMTKAVNKLEEISKDDKIKIMLVELDIDEYLYNLNNQKQQNLLKQVEAKNKPDSAKAKRVLKELQSQFESLEKRISNLEKLQKEKGNKIVVAGGLFMTFGTQVVSLFGASYREYMKFNGQFFLNFKMIKYALNNGYKKYNFYGITGKFNEDSEMFGLFDFKRGFNAHVEELIGEFTLITNKFFYKVYNLMFEVYKKTKKMKGHNK
jgi:predicted transposase/invertase (TIGR01784 family)